MSSATVSRWNVVAMFCPGIACALLSSAAIAQQTVGNGTVILPSAGQREAYGINFNPGAVSGATSEQSEFLTRHSRRGQDTGIGGSFIGTTSPTSESARPTAQVVSPAATQAMQFHLPALQSPLYETSLTSPTVSPALGLSSGTSMRTEFTPSNGLSSVGVEALPSFSRRSSPLQKMDFTQFGNFGRLGK